MSTKTVICEYCFEPIAKVDLDKLAVPMKPEMFTSVNPAYEVPPPFPEGLEWIDFHCPMCRFRPFYTEDSITVIDEHANREKIQINTGFVCDQCGKTYQHQSSLSRHIKETHGN